MSDKDTVIFYNSTCVFRLRLTASGKHLRDWTKHPLVSALLIVVVNLGGFILIAPYAPSGTAGAAFLLPVLFLSGDISKLSPLLYSYLSGPTWIILLISGMWGAGTIVGSLISALAGRNFKLRRPRAKIAARSFGGGLLMGLGVALTHGCNLLHILGGTPLLVPASILASAAIIVGAYICLRLMLKYGV